MFRLSDFEPWWRFGFALLIGLVFMTAVSYSGALTRSKTETGIPTEVAAILTFLFGVGDGGP